MARILVVEDEPAVRDVVVRALQTRGHDVSAVANGLDARALLQDQAFDLLLTDVVMPGLDGVTLALEAAERWPAMRVLIMTGYAEEQHRSSIETGAVCAVLSKPFSLSDVCDAATSALAA
jgi:two-component system cell cycle response regulator CpdR